jgi:hypothetical protein
MKIKVIIIVIISIQYLFTNVLAEKEKCCYIASTNTQIKQKHTKQNMKQNKTKKKTRGRNTKADEMMSQLSHIFPSRYSTLLLTQLMPSQET